MPRTRQRSSGKPSESTTYAGKKGKVAVSGRTPVRDRNPPLLIPQRRSLTGHRGMRPSVGGKRGVERRPDRRPAIITRGSWPEQFQSSYCEVWHFVPDLFSGYALS